MSFLARALLHAFQRGSRWGLHLALIAGLLLAAPGSALAAPGSALAAPAVAAAAPGAATGVVRYVNQAATGANNGSSWANAYTYLSDALQAAMAGDQVWVAAGVYTPTLTLPLDTSETFTLTQGVAVYGGFAGGEASLAARDPAAHPVVLSCDLQGNDGPGFTNRGDNCFQVVTVPGVPAWPGAHLDGVTIRGGYARPPAPALGGGVFQNSGRLTLENITITDNQADIGAGVFSQATVLTMTQVTLSGNQAQAAGGGLFLVIGQLVMSQVTFDHNRAGIDGGGMFSQMSQVSFNGGAFSNNTSRNRGGGLISQLDTSLVLNGVAFTGNQVGSPDIAGTPYGGGMFSSLTPISLTQVTFSGNTAAGASSYGGGLYHSDVPARLDQVTFTGNTAGQGGGMYGAALALTMTQVTASDNLGISQGGGMYINGGMYVYSSLAISGGSFTGNQSPQIGGGLVVAGADTRLEDVTFSNNSAFIGGGYHYASGPANRLTRAAFDHNTASVNGGGLLSNAGLTELSQVSFAHNSAGQMGGGAYTTGGMLQLKGGRFDQNSAAQYGGGILNGTALAQVAGAGFSGNQSGVYGGGLVNLGGGRLELLDSYFSANQAGVVGGGITNQGPALVLTNTLFSANTAQAGAGIYSQSSAASLANTTFNGNAASLAGGALYASGGQTWLYNSILWGDSTEIYKSLSTPTVVSATHTIVQGGYPGAANLDADPHFKDPVALPAPRPVDLDRLTADLPAIEQAVAQVRLPEPVILPAIELPALLDLEALLKGGLPEPPVDLPAQPLPELPALPQPPVEPLELRAAQALTITGDLQLAFPSPAIDSGDSAAITVTHDLAGNPRFVGLAVDRGAFEAMPAVGAITRAAHSPTNAASAPFTVTFNLPVSGVDLGDFAVSATGGQAAAALGVLTAVNARTYRVTVSTVDLLTGTLRLDLHDDDSIIAASPLGPVPLGGPGSVDAGFTAGESYLVDRQGPRVAGLLAPPPVRDATAYDFTVTFHDSLEVLLSSLDGSDVVVSGPGGYSAPTALVSFSPSPDGQTVQAIYRIVPPGGSWNAPNQGVYTVSLVGSVSDLLGNQAPSGVVGSFTATLFYMLFFPVTLR